jgi:Tfp pilus assembly protein PilV
MKSASRGFTLIETLFATVILMTAAVAITSLFISSVRVNADNRDRANAVLLAGNKMEELRQAASADSGTEFVFMTGTSVPYRREWRMEGAASRSVVVVVSTHDKELARISTTVSPKW